MSEQRTSRTAARPGARLLLLLGLLLALAVVGVARADTAVTDPTAQPATSADTTQATDPSTAPAPQGPAATPAPVDPAPVPVDPAPVPVDPAPVPVVPAPDPGPGPSGGPSPIPEPSPAPSPDPGPVGTPAPLPPTADPPGPVGAPADEPPGALQDSLAAAKPDAPPARPDRAPDAAPDAATAALAGPARTQALLGPADAAGALGAPDAYRPPPAGGPDVPAAAPAKAAPVKAAPAGARLEALLARAERGPLGSASAAPPNSPRATPVTDPLSSMAASRGDQSTRLTARGDPALLDVALPGGAGASAGSGLLHALAAYFLPPGNGPGSHLVLVVELALLGLLASMLAPRALGARLAARAGAIHAGYRAVALRPG